MNVLAAAQGEIQHPGANRRIREFIHQDEAAAQRTVRFIGPKTVGF
jgi:hypothetical protein